MKMVLTTEPGISIVLPVFNGERYLAGQLQSIREQTLGDFELLVLDDGSSDSSQEIARRIAASDDRFRICPSNGNLGQKARLIELIAASRAPLIAIADQDDLWHAQKLERLMASIDNAALAFGRSELIDADGKQLNRSLLQAIGVTPSGEDRLSLLFRPQVSGHSLLARREIFTDTAFRSPEPYDWLLSLGAAFSRGIVYVDEAIVYHRMHRQNSYNDAVLARLNPVQIRPKHIAKAVRKLTGLRARFLAGLDFISKLEVAPPRIQGIFEEISRQCRAAWVNEGQPHRPSALHLHNRILDALEPFAGSRRDWRTTVRRVRMLTLLPFA